MFQTTNQIIWGEFQGFFWLYLVFNDLFHLTHLSSDPLPVLRGPIPHARHLSAGHEVLRCFTDEGFLILGITWNPSSPCSTMWVPETIAKLARISPIALVYNIL